MAGTKTTKRHFPTKESYERRLAQNRAAQQRYRSKREHRILELEARVQELEANETELQKIQAENLELKERVKALLSERAPPTGLAVSAEGGIPASTVTETWPSALPAKPVHVIPSLMKPPTFYYPPSPEPEEVPWKDKVSSLHTSGSEDDDEEALLKAYSEYLGNNAAEGEKLKKVSEEKDQVKREPVPEDYWSQINLEGDLNNDLGQENSTNKEDQQVEWVKSINEYEQAVQSDVPWDELKAVSAWKWMKRAFVNGMERLFHPSTKLKQD